MRISSVKTVLWLAVNLSCFQIERHLIHRAVDSWQATQYHVHYRMRFIGALNTPSSSLKLNVLMNLLQACNFSLHKTLTWYNRVDYCDVFISCLDSGIHSLQRIHWWVNDVRLKHILGCGTLILHHSFILLLFFPFSPRGHKVRSRVELVKFISASVDLTNFDFKTGQLLGEGPRKKKVSCSACSLHFWLQFIHIFPSNTYVLESIEKETGFSPGTLLCTRFSKWIARYKRR